MKIELWMNLEATSGNTYQIDLREQVVLGFGIDPIPSKYRASIADINIDTF